MAKRNLKAFLPVLIFFVITSALAVVARKQLEAHHISQTVLIWGNLFLFVITYISFLVAVAGTRSANSHAFVRGVYGSIMIKLFACMIAAFAYLALNRSTFNKPAFFTLMGFYLVYTFSEVAAVMKLLKRPANA